MVWILSWRSLLSAKVSRWYAVGLLAIEVEESLHLWDRRVLCGWLLVGAGVLLASSASRGCEAELCVCTLRLRLGKQWRGGELVVVCPEIGDDPAARLIVAFHRFSTVLAPLYPDCPLLSSSRECAEWALFLWQLVS